MMRARRTLGFELGTALAGLVFSVMSGMTGIEIHPLSHVGPSSGELVALELHTGAPEHPASHAPSHAHHGAPADAQPEQGESVAVAGSAPSHEHHGAGQECTCVGACHGGASPTTPSATTAVVVSGEIVLARVPMRAPVVVFEDPSSYLFPLPNAPPNHA